MDPCCGVACLEIQMTPATAIQEAKWIHVETQPSEDPSSDALQLKDRQRTLHQKNPALFTNRYRRIGPGVISMKLDAEFSEDPTREVQIDESSLPLLAQMKWGAKQLVHGWYAFTNQSSHIQTPWLHAIVLQADNCALLTFKTPDTLNCRRSNMDVVPRLESMGDNIKVNKTTGAPPRTNDPDKLSKLPAVFFEAGQTTYSRGRWCIRFSLNGTVVKKAFGLPAGIDEREAIRQGRIIAEAAQQVNLDTEARNHRIHNQQRRLWCNAVDVPRAVPLDDNGIEVTQEGCEDYTSPNIDYVGERDNDGYVMGHRLSGLIRQHCHAKWCMRWGPGPNEFCHVGTRLEAVSSLLQHNRNGHSIQRWKELHPNKRCIRIGPRELVHDNDPRVIEALKKHNWILDELGAVNSNEQSDIRTPAHAVARLYIQHMTGIRIQTDDAFNVCRDAIKVIRVTRQSVTGKRKKEWIQDPDQPVVSLSDEIRNRASAKKQRI